MTLTLAQIQAQFQKAVAADSFGRAEALLGDFSDALKRTLAAVPANERRVLADALRWFEWARRQILAKRAHCASKLADTRTAARYVATGRAEQHHWELQG